MIPALRNASMNPRNAAPSHRLESLFDSVFGTDAGFPAATWGGMPLEVWADDDSYYVEAELPGVAEADLDLTIHNGVLTIRADRKPAEGRRHLFNSRMYGRIERVITLPEPVSSEAVQARFADGVLCLTLPKRPEAKPKKISLKTE